MNELTESLFRTFDKVRAELNPPPVQIAPAPAPVVQTTDNDRVEPKPQIPAPVVKHLPTDKQLRFFNTLLNGKVLQGSERDYLRQMVPQMSRMEMSNQISRLTTIPWERKAAPVPAPVVIPSVPAVKHLPTDKQLQFYIDPTLATGRYALNDVADQTLKFYDVRTPNKGKWMGKTFVSLLSGDQRIPIRDRADRNRIMTEIAAAPLEAMKLYGQTIGCCGHCRKQLTDEESRKFGIGPICRKKLGV